MKSKKGLSLQLLVTINILMMLSVVIFVIFDYYSKSKIKDQTIAEVEQSGTEIVKMITQSIQDSEAINFPERGATAEVLSLDATADEYDPTILDLSINTAQLKRGSADPIPLNSSRILVSDLIFQNLSGAEATETIRFQFLMTYFNPTGLDELAFSKKFSGLVNLGN
jgi:hypothetical protein